MEVFLLVLPATIVPFIYGRWTEVRSSFIIYFFHEALVDCVSSLMCFLVRFFSPLFSLISFLALVSFFRH